jgi:hypothetical protein
MPWVYLDTGEVFEADADGFAAEKLVCTLAEASDKTGELLASAPDLADALSDAIDVLDGLNDDEINVELMPRLRATLAQARGQA